jgi:hypothetical protein
MKSLGFMGSNLDQFLSFSAKRPLPSFILNKERENSGLSGGFFPSDN